MYFPKTVDEVYLRIDTILDRENVEDELYTAVVKVRDRLNSLEYEGSEMLYLNKNDVLTLYKS